MPSPSATLAAAVAHHRAGRLAEAAALCRQVVAADPQQIDALFFLGQLSLQLRDPAAAADLFRRALARRPDAAPLHLQLGLALRLLQQPEAALASFRQAVALAPTLAEAHHQLGNALKALHRFADALTALREAARLAPHSGPVWLNLGAAALESGATAEAIAAFQRALALEPQRPEAHNILGHALATAGRSTEAHAAFAAALRLRPDFAAAHDNLGRLCKNEGRLDEARSHYRAALAAKPDPATHSNLLVALNYLPGLDPAEVCAEHRRWHDLYAAKLSSASAPHASRPTPHASRRLRIGYLSPDFCHHAVAYFIAPVLAAHDRSRFEIFCYAHVATPDRVTARLQGLAEHWRDITRLDDDAAAALIRADELDLLIDLAGHTARHRLLVLARRPAPLQLTWIGYPNTTGLAAIDYRITDAISDPPGQTEAFHSEKLLRLPESFSCYEPDPAAPPVHDLPALAGSGITFGCFNNFSKVTPAVLALWARLLREIPDSRLFLKSRVLADPAVAARVHAAFAAESIAPERLLLDGAALPVRDHLALYHQVDVALDPSPYNGTTTTCEALWMGVPVITLAGRVHAARVGASLLTHAGLTAWIARDEADYLRIATNANADRPALAALRATLRERLRASPICDAPRFTRHLEAALASLVAP